MLNYCTTFRRILLVLLLLLPFTGYSYDENEVKVAFVYNILKHTDWACKRELKSIKICVMGKDVLVPFLKMLEGQEIGGKKVHIGWDQQDFDCDVLFIGGSEEQRLKEIISLARGKCLLTVSNDKRFGKAGVMINLFTEKERVKFEVNLGSLESEGIKISSRVLRFAKILK